MYSVELVPVVRRGRRRWGQVMTTSPTSVVVSLRPSQPDQPALSTGSSSSQLKVHFFQPEVHFFSSRYIFSAQGTFFSAQGTFLSAQGTFFSLRYIFLNSRCVYFFSSRYIFSAYITFVSAQRTFWIWCPTKFRR